MKRFALVLVFTLAPALAHADAAELVAPVALYPDVLLGQILLASRHVDEVAHGRIWLDARGGESAADLAQAVDGEDWDPDIKALALPPGMLAALNRNFAWMVALGEAYTSAPAEVMQAVQRLRHEALAAGELASTPAQNVIEEGSTILIQPADGAVAYVPGGSRYDIGVFERFTCGWHSWAVDWRHGAVRYQDELAARR